MSAAMQVAGLKTDARFSQMQTDTLFAASSTETELLGLVIDLRMSCARTQSTLAWFLALRQSYLVIFGEETR